MAQRYSELRARIEARLALAGVRAPAGTSDGELALMAAEQLYAEYDRFIAQVNATAAEALENLGEPVHKP